MYLYVYIYIYLDMYTFIHIERGIVGWGSRVGGFGFVGNKATYYIWGLV